MSDDLFVIDFETRGNVIRLYYGNDPDYWGDDWNDRPYECNAERVYDEYVKAISEFGFDFSSWVLTAESDYRYSYGTPYSKEDFQKRKAPCLVIVSNYDEYSEPTYSEVIGDDSDNVLKIYYGDKKKDVEEKIYRMFGKLLSEFVK